MMKKFKVFAGLMVMGLGVSLIGCVGQPPEQSLPPAGLTEDENKPANQEEPLEAKEDEGEDEKEELKVYVKAGEGAFKPSEAMAGVITIPVDQMAFEYIYSYTEDSLEEAKEQGHFYAATIEGGPEIMLKSGDAIMGDTVDLATTESVKVEISNLQSGSVVKIINQEGVVEEKKVLGDAYEKLVLFKEGGFYFVEVWTGNMEPLAVTNPIIIE